MNRPKQKSPVRRPEILDAEPVPQPRHVIERRTFEGPVPHPEIMRGYEELVPGTAARMFAHAEEEAKHRRDLERMTTEANISAQQTALAIEGKKTGAIMTSDLVGQIAGVVVSLACVIGAIYLAMHGHYWVAGALTAIPSAAVIQAFVARKAPARPAK